MKHSGFVQTSGIVVTAKSAIVKSMYERVFLALGMGALSCDLSHFPDSFIPIIRLQNRKVLNSATFTTVDNDRVRMILNDTSFIFFSLVC